MGFPPHRLATDTSSDIMKFCGNVPPPLTCRKAQRSDSVWLGIIVVLNHHTQLLGWHSGFGIGNIIEPARKRCKRCRKLYGVSLKGCFALDFARVSGKEISPYGEGIAGHYDVVSGQRV